jgi:hypothetical protein
MPNAKGMTNSPRDGGGLRDAKALVQETVALFGQKAQESP